jgi:hypothetical protein
MQENFFMRPSRIMVCVFAGAVALAAGCKKNAVDQSAFKSALNNYYSGRQDCLWSAPIKFPVQTDTSNDDQTRSFDALTDAGLLMRKSAEKKRFLIGSKQVNDYDLSDQGRAAWTADSTQPGYGNFCFGHPEVTSVDGFTPADSTDARYTVNYHYGDTHLPAWATTAEMKTAFPKLAAETSDTQTASAVLVKTNDSWQVQSVQPTNPATPATPPPASQQ